MKPTFKKIRPEGVFPPEEGPDYPAMIRVRIREQALHQAECLECMPRYRIMPSGARRLEKPETLCSTSIFLQSEIETLRAAERARHPEI